MNDIAIHWFRQDLRLSDNPSLIKAIKHNNVLPIYILDNKNADNFEMGATSKWWLESSLRSLNDSLGGKVTPSIYLKTLFFGLILMLFIGIVAMSHGESIAIKK
jgi:deoxyribodipyrimidine photolyase